MPTIHRYSGPQHYLWTPSSHIFKKILAMEIACLPADTPYIEESKNWPYPIEWWTAKGEQGEPAGFAALSYYGWDKPKHAEVYLARSGVLPKFRGMGLQRKLIKIRESRAKSLAIKYGKKTLTILTYTSGDNYVSANNLAACGYKLYGPADNWGLKGGLYFQKVMKFF